MKQSGLHGGTFPNRERDEKEVKNYYQALGYVERLIKSGDDVISERDVKTIHGLVMEGKEKPTSYRDGQNVIKDSASGAIVYMPPEAEDVPELMVHMMAWINTQREQGALTLPPYALFLPLLTFPPGRNPVSYNPREKPRPLPP